MYEVIVRTISVRTWRELALGYASCFDLCQDDVGTTVAKLWQDGHMCQISPTRDATRSSSALMEAFSIMLMPRTGRGIRCEGCVCVHHAF